jgi:hypothetical protein
LVLFLLTGILQLLNGSCSSLWPIQRDERVIYLFICFCVRFKLNNW